MPETQEPSHLPNCRDGYIDERRGKIPLAAGLHRDGTIHIYAYEQDSGLSVGLLEDGTLVVKVDESKRAMGTAELVSKTTVKLEVI